LLQDLYRYVKGEVKGGHGCVADSLRLSKGKGPSWAAWWDLLPTSTTFQCKPFTGQYTQGVGSDVCLFCGFCTESHTVKGSTRRRHVGVALLVWECVWVGW